MKRLYQRLLDIQFTLGWFFTDEAGMYIARNIDLGYEDAVRHVLRYTLIPMYETLGPSSAAHLKEILEWALNCASDAELIQLNGTQDWILDDTDPPRLLFEWLWKELYGDEPWQRDEICDAELVYGALPPELKDRTKQWTEWIDPEVLRFPRRDGLPPGHGAPADPNKRPNA